MTAAGDVGYMAAARGTGYMATAQGTGYMAAARDVETGCRRVTRHPAASACFLPAPNIHIYIRSIILDELHKNPNITKVAAKLYITQPTLTKRLQAMEEEFQVRIVNRSTKGVEFTPEGEFLAGRARIFLSFMKETVRGVDAFKTSGCGTVRLASSFTFSRRQLAEILMAYKSEHPNISFEIQNLRSYELTRLVEEGGADGAFVRGNYEGGIDRCLVLREQAYAISKTPIALEELPDRPMVHCRLSSYSRKLMDSWWQHNFSRPPSIGATAEDVDTCCQLACKGLGYTLIDR